MAFRSFLHPLKREFGGTTAFGGIAFGLDVVYVQKNLLDKDYKDAIAVALFCGLIPVPVFAYETYKYRNEIKQWIYTKPYQLQNPNPDKRVRY